MSSVGDIAGKGGANRFDQVERLYDLNIVLEKLKKKFNGPVALFHWLSPSSQDWRLWQTSCSTNITSIKFLTGEKHFFPVRKTNSTLHHPWTEIYISRSKYGDAVETSGTEVYE